MDKSAVELVLFPVRCCLRAITFDISISPNGSLVESWAFSRFSKQRIVIKSMIVIYKLKQFSFALFVCLFFQLSIRKNDRFISVNSINLDKNEDNYIKHLFKGKISQDRLSSRLMSSTICYIKNKSLALKSRHKIMLTLCH